MGMDFGSFLPLGLGAAAGVALASRQRAPSLPAMPAPDPVPQSQAAKAPEAADVLKSMQSTGQAGGAPGVAQTLLTGAGGVDQKTLKLAHQSLYGS
jgi:hypothetical protein